MVYQKARMAPLMLAIFVILSGCSGGPFGSSSTQTETKTGTLPIHPPDLPISFTVSQVSVDRSAADNIEVTGEVSHEDPRDFELQIALLVTDDNGTVLTARFQGLKMDANSSRQFSLSVPEQDAAVSYAINVISTDTGRDDAVRASGALPADGQSKAYSTGGPNASLALQRAITQAQQNETIQVHPGLVRTWNGEPYFLIWVFDGNETYIDNLVWQVKQYNSTITAKLRTSEDHDAIGVEAWMPAAALERLIRRQGDSFGYISFGQPKERAVNASES